MQKYSCSLYKKLRIVLENGRIDWNSAAKRRKNRQNKNTLFILEIIEMAYREFDNNIMSYSACLKFWMRQLNRHLAI